MIYEVSIILPPEAGSEQEFQDLEDTIFQHSNHVVPSTIQERCDADIVGLFRDLLLNRGIKIKEDPVKDLQMSVIDTVSSLKDLFDRDRPSRTAQHYGIPWVGDDLDSAQSRAYPSGHTVQAYILAIQLAKEQPVFKSELMTLAEMISQSRIDRGVHFPTDVNYGKVIAKEISNQI